VLSFAMLSHADGWLALGRSRDLGCQFGPWTNGRSHEHGAIRERFRAETNEVNSDSPGNSERIHTGGHYFPRDGLDLLLRAYPKTVIR